MPPSPTLSVLSVEPYGMKHQLPLCSIKSSTAFSALGRAVWDETHPPPSSSGQRQDLSVLSVEPYGMKHCTDCNPPTRPILSVLSVEPYGMKLVDASVQKPTSRLSVLSVEPYGMKPRSTPERTSLCQPFSALGRAVWDETPHLRLQLGDGSLFQCSRSSRMG